ncbi:hypothetical protein L1856_36310 [Streptomyces sp. Tue 6430]|nr:hypothetical protein [Streptomyces sp. Tue 6430]
MPVHGHRAPRRPGTGRRTSAAWLAFLCPVHTVDLSGWPGAADHPDTGTMPCGTALDYVQPAEYEQAFWQSQEQVPQSA